MWELENFTPSRSAGTSTARPATAASTSPPTSATGAVHGGQSVVGECVRSPSTGSGARGGGSGGAGGGAATAGASVQLCSSAIIL